MKLIPSLFLPLLLVLLVGARRTSCQEYMDYTPPEEAEGDITETGSEVEDYSELDEGIDFDNQTESDLGEEYDPSDYEIDEEAIFDEICDE